MSGTLAPALVYNLVDNIAAGTNKIYGPIPAGITILGVYIFANAVDSKTKVDIGTYAGGVFTSTGTICDGSDLAGAAIPTKQAWVLITSSFSTIPNDSYIRVSAVEVQNNKVVIFGVTDESTIRSVATT